jgi:hypothetical protein
MVDEFYFPGLHRESPLGMPLPHRRSALNQWRERLGDKPSCYWPRVTSHCQGRYESRAWHRSRQTPSCRLPSPAAACSDQKSLDGPPGTRHTQRR